MLASSPAPGAFHVATEQPLRFRFDRLLRPTSVIRQSVDVTPGVYGPDGSGPAAGFVFFEPRYDPYDGVLTFQLPAGARWQPHTRYAVRLRPPSNERDITGIQAFDGAPLAQPVAFFFVTGTTVTDPSADRDVSWPDVSYCLEDGVEPQGLPSVREVFASSCAAAHCHGEASGQSRPAFGLDLSSAEGVRSTAIRVVARQTLTGESVGAPLANPLPVGDNVPRIDPGNAANSYVLLKMLVQPLSYADASEPSAAAESMAGELLSAEPPDDEIARLRASFVRGQPMPPDRGLTAAQVRAVVAWIAAGARVDHCP